MSGFGGEAEILCSTRTLPVLPSRPGEFHPEPLTDPDMTLSRHPARAIARRLPPSAEHSGSSRYDPVDPSQPPVLTPSNPLSTLHRRFACARLSQPCLTGSSPDFSATLTTMAFDHSSLRWLEIST